MKFADQAWKEEDWKAILERLISEQLLSWREVTSLALGHMNPSQVGTSLASSAGFKRNYGKGKVMPVVMTWFYEQNGKCADCGTRLELQADHSKPREEHKDPLDADYICNMVLRCRRCNVIKRPSHEFGGQTYLTAESALMWILLSFRPRTLNDFVRMCRLYGMTMADVRMQEGWAMAHWLRRDAADRYVIDDGGKPCRLLQWPDGGVTRSWDDDEVPQVATAKTFLTDASPYDHLVVVAAALDEKSENARVQAIRLKIGGLPFSHYFPEDGPETLAITYSPPKRKRKGKGKGEEGEGEAVDLAGTADQEVFEELAEEAEDASGKEVVDLPRGATINYLAPRGMRVLTVAVAKSDQDAVVSWPSSRGAKSITLAASSRGKRLCDCTTKTLPSFKIDV